MNGNCVFLSDRGVVEVAGAEATGFLQRLITNSVRDIPQGESRYSGLLSPQGKVLFDFFVVPLPEGPDAGYLFDCVRAQAGDLVKRLNLHKMRAKIAIERQIGTIGRGRHLRRRGTRSGRRRCLSRSAGARHGPANHRVA